MGGGGFSMEPENPLLDEFVLGLTGKVHPRVCFLATATGDSERYLANFYTAFAEQTAASHLPLFVRDGRDPREHLLQQDVIYVGGGNTANMLAIWRLHGVDEILREALAGGAVLCGLSAGAICWFECSVTDSFGPLAPLQDGLGFLPGSACPHYDGEVDRRPAYHALVGDGTLTAGHAADDGAALHFKGTELVEAVSSRPEARVYRVERGADGSAVETALPTRYLGGD